MDFLIVADAGTALTTIIGSEGGIAALVASALTWLAIKLVDHFLVKKGEEDKVGLVELSLLRKELMEEAKQLRQDAREMLIEHERLRERYFEVREELSVTRTERAAEVFGKSRYKARSSYLASELIEVIEYIQEMGFDDVDPHLAIRINGLQLLVDEDDEEESEESEPSS